MVHVVARTVSFETKKAEDDDRFSRGDRDPEAQLRDLRIYASYSPDQVMLRYMAEPDPQPLAEPEANRFPAAIGFVDISGFTALAEKLNKEYKRKGAELLNQ